MSNKPQLNTVQSVALGANHHASRTKHTILDKRGSRPFPPFVALEIATPTGKQGCFLFHICANGQVADTWHQTIEEAVQQAEYEFGVRPEEWIRHEGPDLKTD